MRIRASRAPCGVRLLTSDQCNREIAVNASVETGNPSLKVRSAHAIQPIPVQNT